MQALKLLGQQLTKIWHQLGLNQKLTVIISGVAVIAGLAGLVYWTARPDYELLYDGLGNEESARIIQELEQRKVIYQLGPGGSSIKVPRDKKYSLRAELILKGIPKSQNVGYELFDKPAWGLSDAAFQQNSVRALQGELEKTLAEFDGVESARVFLVKQDRTLLIDPAKKATASIILKMRSLASMDPRTVVAMRSLVASAVSGLKPNDVSIVDTAGNPLFEPQEDGSLSSLATTQLDSQRSFEKYLAGKVYDLLTPVYGPKDQDVVVMVSVEMDNETVSKSAEIYDPKGKAARMELVDIEQNSSQTPKPGGVPGTDPNSDTKTNAPAFTYANTSTFRTNSQTDYAISRNSTNTSKLPGGIKHIKASVIINTNSNPDLNPEEVQRLVVNAIGIQVAPSGGGEGGSKPDITEVVVIKRAFNTKQQTEFASQIKAEERTELLWKVGRGSLYVLVALAALILFWRLVRSSSEELLPTGIPVGQLVGGQLVYEAPSGAPGMGFPSGMVQSMTDQRVEEVVSADQDVEELQAAKSKLVMDFGLGQAAPERITIEVLKQLIRENPGKMGQAARIWLQRKSDEG